MNKHDQYQMLQGRTVQDAKQWNSQIGKIYYQRCPDNPKYFRSIRIAHNPFTNSTQPQISEAIYGEPPEGLEPIPPLMLTRLMRIQNMSAFI